MRFNKRARQRLTNETGAGHHLYGSPLDGDPLINGWRCQHHNRHGVIGRQHHDGIRLRRLRIIAAVLARGQCSGDPPTESAEMADPGHASW